jgi:hypothetical protein
MAAPLVIVGCLSKFHEGTSSTPVQRGVLMTWLASGQIFGILMAVLMRDRNNFSENFVKAPAFTDSADRKALITDELLQRLDINADQESRRKFESMVSLFELTNFAAMKPVVSLVRAFPEITALYLYMANAVVYGICGIWGFVIVGQMLLDYGNCIRVY